MNEIKCFCPICHEPLDTSKFYIDCKNPKCKKKELMSATKRVWEEITTLQAVIETKTNAFNLAQAKLSVAQWWLEKISVLPNKGLNISYLAPLWASEAIKQIKRIEGGIK